MRPQTPKEEYATPEETQAAVTKLTEGDYLKLMVCAGFWIKNRGLRAHLEPEELIAEAVTKTLEGDRRWRRSAVSFMMHLDQTMRSIASHTKLPEAPAISAADASVRRDPLEALAGREFVARVYELFKDDDEATAVLDLLAAGAAASSIRSDLGLNKTQYGTIRKRIRRTYIRFSAGG